MVNPARHARKPWVPFRVPPRKTLGRRNRRLRRQSPWVWPIYHLNAYRALLSNLPHSATTSRSYLAKLLSCRQTNGSQIICFPKHCSLVFQIVGTDNHENPVFAELDSAARSFLWLLDIHVDGQCSMIHDR